MELKSFTIINRTLILKKSKYINFYKNDIMKEGIMKATQQLSNNMIQSLVINKINLENQFLQRTKAGKSFGNEMSLIKISNKNGLEKSNIETINNERNNRLDNSYLSLTQINLKSMNNLNKDYNEYFANNEIDINSKNNIQPQNQNIINFQINNYNNFSNNSPNINQKL